MNIANFVTVILIAAFISVMFILITAILSLRQQTRELSKVNVQRNELALKRRESEDFQDELQQLTDRLKRISSMDNLFLNSMIRLTAQLSSEEIVKEITDLLFSFLSAQELAVFLVDERGRRLSVKGQRGLRDELVTKLVYELGDEKKKGKITLCYERKYPVGEREFLSPDDHESKIFGIDEPYPEFDPDICHPLFYREKRFGVIAITRKEALTERERNLLGVVSSIAGVALYNTQAIHTDALTQLHNIGYFTEILSSELNKARSPQYNISVAILDLDNFKTYNDTFGHQAGDLLLMQVAQLFLKHFEGNEEIARYGGDEFIVVFPKTSKEDAAESIRRLLKNTQRFDVARENKKIQVTFSAGISSYPEDAIYATELIRLADQALYKAKGAGRNTVHIYQRHIETL